MTSISKIQGRTTVRGRLLAGAATAAIASMAPTAAHAGNSSVVPGPVATVNGTQTQLKNQQTAAPATANANGSVVGIVTGPQTGTTNTVLPNMITAPAMGNNGVNSLSLNLLSANAFNNGQASLIFQRNSFAIGSNADGNLIRIDIANFATGSATNSDNTISAITTVNNAASTISGTVPGSYNPATGLGATGGLSLITDSNGLFPLVSGPQSRAQGSVAMATVQRISGGASSSSADGNIIRIDVDSTGAGTLTSTATLDGNDVGATYRGNNSANTVSVLGGGAPSFNGSAAIVNDQRAEGDAHAAVAASNDDTQITAEVESGGANVFSGALSVSGNTVTTSATANRSLGADGAAGNSITIASGMSFNDGPTAGNIFSNPLGLNNLSGAFQTGGSSYIFNYNDLSIASTQRNFDALQATTANSLVSATVDQLDSAQVDVNGNLVEASATGNTAGNSIGTGAGGASFAGSASITNHQFNTNDAAIGATVEASEILATVGEPGEVINDSDVSVSSNDVRAQAVGNSSDQDLALRSVDLAIGSGPALLVAGSLAGADGVLSLGNAVINNNQSNRTSPVASSVDSLVQLNALGREVVDSALLVEGNAQEAIAIGNGTSNTLALTGTSMGSGGGINSLQDNNQGSNISATSTATAELLANGPDGSDLSLSDNLQRAIAYGNSAANSGTVNANSAAIGTSAAPASLVAGAAATSNAAFGVLNHQTTNANVDADIAPATSPLLVDIGGSAEGSSIVAEDNDLVAAAYGSDALNELDLALGNLSTGGFANVGNVTNAQILGGSVSAAGSSDAGPFVGIDIAGGVNESGVSVAGNDLQALALGNRATSSLTASATNSDTGSTAASDGAVLLAGAVDASFSAHSNQTAGAGSVSASLISGPVTGDGSVIIGGTVVDSTVGVTDNSADADATANWAETSLVLAATGLSSTAGVLNAQESQADVTATAGDALGVSGGFVIGNNGTVTNSALTVADNERGASATGNQASSSLSATGTNISGAGFNAAATADGDSAEADFTLGNSQSLPQPVDILASAYGNYGMGFTGATTVTNSALNVTGNSQSANARGNLGSNSLSVNATNTAADSDDGVNSALLSVQETGRIEVLASNAAGFYTPSLIDTSSASISDNSVSSLAVINGVTNVSTVSAANLPGGADPASSDDAGTTQADHVLQNIQSTDGSAGATSVGVFANNDAGGADVTDSALQINGNAVTAQASANEATNTASVAGAASNGASAALTNYQTSDGSVGASASSLAGPQGPFQGFFINGTITDSSVDVDDNDTVSLARGNAAVNTLTLSGGSLASSGVEAQAEIDYDPVLGFVTVSADGLLLNSQENGSGVTAVSLGNYGTIDNTAVATSSLSVSGNSVAAGAFGNASLNSAAINGVGNGASGGVVNNQDNGGIIQASATANLGITGSGVAAVGLTDSSASVSGNSVAATAAGNTTINALNYTGTQLAPLNSGGGVNVSATGVVTANGDALVLNSQTNTAAVTANAVSNVAALTFTGSVTNSSLNVGGNSLSATAFGNNAVNTLNVSGVNNAASATLANNQINSGPITANATGNVGINIGGTTNSALSVGGNAITASAVGNNAVSSITNN